MKIAVVGFCFNHPNGGVRNSKVFYELSKFKNVKIDLITVTNWKGYHNTNLKKLENKNLKVHYLKPFFFSKISLIYRYYMKGLYKKLKEINPDFIYIVEEPLAINTFLTAIYAKKLNKKVMCFTWENLSPKKILPIRVYQRFVLKNMNKIIAGSKDAKNVIVKKGYPENNIYVLPQTGMDTKLFSPKKKNLCKELGIKKEKTCLFVGRLEDEKGIEYILDAKKILEKKEKEITFLFVGEGKWYSHLKKMSESDRRIKVLKWIEQNRLPEVYSSASVFLYPSVPTKLWEEQFGYSMVEALSCGVPVIASDMSGPREIITEGKDGFTIKSKDAKKLAEKIEFVISDEKRWIELSQNAIKNMKRFNNKHIANTYLHHFRSMLKD